MNLNRNDILIISELLQASGYMSAKKLGTNCHLSGRQIREQIGQLKTILAKEGYELHSERSKGYALRPVYPNTLEQLEEEIEKQKIDENRKERKLSDRHGDIIVRLVEEGGYLKANQIADEMMISRSTFLNSLKNVKEQIRRYRLCILSKPNYGLKIEGSEYSMRKIMLDTLFGAGQESEMIYYLLNQPVFLKTPERKVIEIIRNHHLIMSDESCFDFLLYLSISLSRMVKGWYLQENQEQTVTIPERYEEAGNAVYEYLRTQFPIEENSYERRQVLMELVSKSTLHPEDGTAFDYKEELMETITKNLEETYCIDFSSNLEFQKKLSILMESILYHIVFFTKQRTGLYYKKKNNFFLEDTFAQVVDDVLREKLGHGVGEGDRLRLQTFYRIYQNMQMLKQQRVLVVGAADQANMELISYYIRHKHAYYVKSVVHHPLYLLQEVPEQNYDVIISMIDLPADVDLKKPTICVTPILTTTDHAKIANFFELISYKQSITYRFNKKLYLQRQGRNLKESPTILAQMFEDYGYLIDREDQERLYQFFDETWIDLENGLSAFRFHLDVFPCDVIIPIVFTNEGNTSIVFAVSYRHKNATIFRCVCALLETMTRRQSDALLNDPSRRHIIQTFQKSAESGK